MEYIVGSRGSALALAQTQWVIDRLQAAYPQHRFSVAVITTRGDRILDRPLDQVGGKGIFVREIEQQLLDGTIQMAVHSLKDMPAAPPEGLCYTRFWRRQDPREALVLAKPTAFPAASPLAALPQGASVGTGSKRRIAQLLALRPDLRPAPIRGNVGTRIEKMHAQGMDGLVLAAAGLRRLEMENRIAFLLDPDQFVPAPGQGTLALEVAAENTELRTMLDSLSDPETHLCAAAERAFLARVDGGCHLPVGACCRLEGDRAVMTGLLGSADGQFVGWQRGEAPAAQAEQLALELADRLLARRKEACGQ